jgi:hypothetical protein
MTRQRFVLLFVAALLALAAGLLINKQRNSSSYGSQDASLSVALIPSLSSDMASVTTVTVRKGSAAPTVTIHKVGDAWTVAELNEYPADVAKLRRLLLSLRDAKTIEQKTSDPTRYAILGVEDPTQPGATGAEVTIVAPAGKHAVIVGKSLGDGSFVRRAGEAQSYSVEPAISVESEPRFWIDSHLIDLPSTNIDSIQVKPATGTQYQLKRIKAPEPPKTTAPSANGGTPAATPAAPAARPAAPAPDPGFTLDGVPAGRKALDAHALAPSPTLLTNLTAEDVAAASTVDFTKSSLATVSLNDGTVLTITGAVIGNKHWVQVQSSKDAALTAKAQGRAFEIPGYRYDAIFKPVDQLLVAKEPPKSKGAAAPAP